uniref:Glucosidase II subunit alpha n=2 Tax=Hirondellea gigas TaxID=1518452 RepID=A0A6A7FRA2_9CRUS
MDIAFINSKHVYGIPEHADTFALKDTGSGDPYRLYNLDVFEYELNNPMALYASIPFMISHSQHGSAGVFWHNAAETWVDVKHLPTTDVVSSITGFFSGGSRGSDPAQQVSTHWMSEAGIIDLFVMAGPQPMDVFRQYAIITGTTNLPPLFSLAYHQCRWNYNDQDDVLTVDQNFDKHDIPMDVMWLDIEHTDGKRYFTWDEHKFPDPVAMTNQLASKGRKLVTIVDPHIKRDPNYFFYKENRDLDHYIKTKDGQEFDGWCWPGSSSYLDMTNPSARKHYMETFSLDRYKGSTLDTFTWNDMNEPSVFNGPEVTMQKDCLHPGLGVEHREIHNANGMLFHASTYEGLLMRSNYQLRPFVLTRAAYAGSQRSTAIWTGDNTAEWGHLKISVPMILSLSVSGMTHVGADIGGFFGNPDGALLARWYQTAAYTPFMRTHSHLDTKRREPWLFDRHTLSVIRRAIRDRYRLLPLWYTLFWENERTGAPPMRPLWSEFPKDETTFGLEYEFMVGSRLLVAPVLDSDATTVSVYFPEGLWYDTHDNSVYQGPDTQTVPAPPEKIPVYQRGGSIVARKERVRRSSALMRDDPYTLIVALGTDGTAQGTLYIDDEHTMDYRKGKYLYILLSYSGSQLVGKVLEPSVPDSRYVTKSWLERVVIVGLNDQPSKITMVTKGGGQVSLEGSFSKGSGRTSSRLIIRKPDINIAQEFTISLH